MTTEEFVAWFMGRLDLLWPEHRDLHHRRHPRCPWCVIWSIAFGSLAFFQGQFVAKVSVTLVALPVVFGMRWLLPMPESAPEVYGPEYVIAS